MEYVVSVATKKELEAQLADAQKTIAALKAEVASLDPKRLDSTEPDWVEMRKALKGHVAETSTRAELVKEAGEIVEAWDGVADVAKEIDFDGWEEDDLLTAMAVHTAFKDAGTSLEKIGIQLWRAGKVGCNADEATVLAALEEIE